MFNFTLSKNPALDIATKTAEILNAKLKDGNVLWLLAGGSAVDYYKLMTNLLDDGLDFSKLTISLGDERYDQNPNHNTATWPILEKTELFKLLTQRGAKVFNILGGKSIDFEAEQFKLFLEESINRHSFVLSSLGVGADGHTAGIIPLDSEKLFKNTYLNQGFAVGHSRGGQHPNRITISPEMIMRSDRVLVYAVGEDKKPVLDILKREDKFFPEVSWSSQLHKYPSMYLTVRNAEIFTDAYK